MALDVFLKVLEQSVPPHPREQVALRRLLQWLLVGHRVVPPKEARRNEVRHHHVYGVVVVRQEDAENPHGAQNPTGPVVPPEPLGGVLLNEEVC